MHTSPRRSAAHAALLAALALATSSGCAPPQAGDPVPGSTGATSSGGGSSSGGSSSGGTKTECVGTSSRAQQQPLALYVMLDRSISMGEAAGGSTSRWAAVTAALSSFVGQTMEGTSVGLQYFPIADTSWTSPTGTSCAASAYATPEVELGPLLQTAPQIRSSMSRQNLLPNTPTSAALQGAVDHASSWVSQAAHANHAAVVVLATDGEPTVCDTDLARIDAIAASGVGKAPAVRTFVIGVGDLRANLDRLARAGGTTSAFIVDTSGSVSAQFLEALNQIRKRAVGCAYAIPAPPSGATLDYGQVNVEYQPGGAGAAVPLGRVADASGCGIRTSAWHYDDQGAPSRIVLCPSTCSTVEADPAAAVEIVLGCTTHDEW